MVTVEQILESDWPLKLDPDFDGSCPCAVLKGDGFKVSVHCWRTSLGGCKCQWSGVHVIGLDLETARKVAEHVRNNNGWTHRDGWAIVLESSLASATDREGEG